MRKIYHILISTINKSLTASGSRWKAQRGQAAVVLILLVAVCLIFYAVVLNMGRVSQVKTIVTVASNFSAGQLASGMASYGQAQIMEQLGGKAKVCSWTGIFAAIIAIILIIITWGTATGWVLAAYLLIAAVAVANLVLQIAVVQPGITSAWNKIISENMSLRNQFSESAVQAGMLNSSTDNVQVPDMIDNDTDRLFGVSGSGQVNDKVGRLAVYYGERLKEIKPPDTAFINVFLQELNDFLYKTTNGPLDPADPSGTGEFGLIDPLPGVDGHECTYTWTWNPAIPAERLPSECNPCCVATGIPDPITGDLSTLPDCCDCVASGTCIGAEDTECGVSTTCSSASPYGLNYKNVYDDSFEDRTSNAGLTPTISFREALGKDDEHTLYFKDSVDPTGSQFLEIFGDEGFHLKDSTSLYGFPIPDINPGIFPFFYKIDDWAFDLNDVSQAVATLPDPNNECYLCDGSPIYGRPECNFGIITLPFGQTQLALPNDPNTLLIGGTNCVDGINNNTVNFPPLAADRAVVPLNIIADPLFCAQDLDPYGSLDPLNGFWKRGSDRFCSGGDAPDPDEWPYFANCIKHGSFGACQEPDENGNPVDVGCNCEQANALGISAPDQWPEDPFDDIIYGLADFYRVAKELLAQSPTELGENIDLWYYKIAEWIEPQGPADLLTPPEVCVECDTERAGWLRLMHTWIKDMRDRLVAFRNTQFEGATCEEVWCVPPPTGSLTYYGFNECANIGAEGGEEIATFDSDGIPGRGHMGDVISCLTWNIEDTKDYVVIRNGVPLTLTATGNAEKFKACSENCTLSACRDLPRAVFGYPPQPSNFKPELLEEAILLGNITPTVDQRHMWKFLTCYWNCSNINCQTLPANKLSDGTPYPTAALPAFDETVDCSGAGLPGTGPVSKTNIPSNTNGWHDAILDSVLSTNALCDHRNRPWLLNIRRSYIEAENQIEKFKVRRDYLQGRLDELDKIIAILDAADNAFYNFLTCDVDATGHHIGPACEFIQNVKDSAEAETGLPYQVIYGWQSEPPKNRPVGYWHIVKSEARLPGKCDNACHADQLPHASDYPWPKVKTKTKNLGTKRCYYITNTEGAVKVRVTRYDENRDPSLLVFPNGEPIWNFKFFHPERSDPVSTTNLDVACPPLPDPAGLPAGVSNIYKGAFILNERKATGGPDDNTACWDRVEDLLSHGVMTETCARYYLGTRDTGAVGWSADSMGIKFVPCLPF